MGEYYFGDWIKEQRELAKLTQKELSEKTNGKITQSTISMWERKDIKIPSVQNILIIVEALNVSLRSVPFDHFILNVSNEKNKKDGKGRDIVKERFSLYELTNASSLKTFKGETYNLKGFIGIEQDTGEVRNITELYYNARTVAKKDEFLAKRKKETDELVKVKGYRKIQEK